MTLVYPPPPGTTPKYDCACFAQKVRGYRMRQYEQDGDKMFVVGGRMGKKSLYPPLVSLLSRGGPKVDFKSCALP